MNETTMVVVGNLVDDPRLRKTESGVDVASFRVASTSRRYDRESARWVDSASLFLNVTCWRALGSNVAASLHKGDPVVVTGRVFTRTYERDGQLRSSYELEATAVGPDLARGTAQFQRLTRPAVPPTYVVSEEATDGAVDAEEGADGARADLESVADERVPASV
jgi:single-strand DNA-binding protein